MITWFHRWHIRIAGVFAVAIMLAEYGCTGQLYTVADGNHTPGVRVYTQVLVLEEWVNTAVVDAQGKVAATLDGSVGTKCHPTREQKVNTYVDYEKPPYYLVYEHGFLEKYDFSVTLANGALQSVNFHAEPDRGQTLHNLIGAAKEAATIGKPSATGDQPNLPLACTAVPVLVNVYRYPQIKEYSPKP